MTPSTTGLRLPAGAALDLHLHTTYSDGRWPPEALLDHLRDEEFALAAVADHDRADTVGTIQRLARERNLPVLVAVEISSFWKGDLVDMLCYGFDPDHNALRYLALDTLHRQRENSREVYENLQRQGYALPPDALAGVLDKPNVVQPHALVAVLKEQGYGLGEPRAGKILLDAGCEFATNEPAAVVEAAHRSGGVCLLAHPGRGDGFVTFDLNLLDQFRREAPIDGLEVYYPLHTPAKTAMFAEYARRHDLLVSAGSDSHGPDKPPVKHRAELCRDLLERVGIEIA
jgi:predicted metal-dependent phosphoesterase TrpH